MFERYTERARRVLFFARYEASQLGRLTIETEHLLLGLIREGKGPTGRLFARAHLSLEGLHEEIGRRTQRGEKFSTAREIPFSAELKRVLGFAAEESDRLLHNYIGTEHLLLGILREERSMAASILLEKGMRLDTVREDIVQLLKEAPEAAETDQRARAITGGTLPHYLPSRVVHITYSQTFYSPTGAPALAQGGHLWSASGRTLTQIVAFAWGSDESLVRLASPPLDANARYDFTIVLAPTDSPEIIPQLLREAIERDFNVEVTREAGELPGLTVKPR
jgi:ATP-dependent Clp protease ATP-binding subunit ClpA